MKNLKTIAYSILLMLSVIIVLPSCHDDAAPVEISSNCYISSVTLGQLKRCIISADQKDTINIVFTPSLFPMTIDQVNGVIENRDSLPFGTNVNRVLCNIGFKGVLVYQYENEDSIRTYEAADSMDLSRPVQFRVYASDGSGSRSYTLRLNVHKQEGSYFNWAQPDTTEALGVLMDRKAVTLGQKVLMLGTCDGALSVASCDVDGHDWTISPITTATGLVPSTLSLAPGAQQMLCSTDQGAVMESTDGQNWTERYPAQTGLQLLGSSDNRTYALQAGKLLSRGANDGEWTDEQCEAGVLDMLPHSQVNIIQLSQPNGYDRVVMVGCSEACPDTSAVVWSKAWRRNASGSADDNERAATWMFYNHTWDNRCLLPASTTLYILPYVDGLVAFGAQPEAWNPFLYSPDYGLTWSQNEEIYLPTPMNEPCSNTAVTVDPQQHIWIMSDKYTWRGALIRLSFK